MKATPIDRFFAAECIKREVDAVHKEAKVEAQTYLDEAREKGQTALMSTYFGEEAGEYKRGKTRAKHVVEFDVSDAEELEGWLRENPDAARAYVMDRAVDFTAYWTENTGEVPDGVTRTERDEPPALKAPQIYRYDHELVKARLAEAGNVLEGANRLLLEDGR